MIREIEGQPHLEEHGWPGLGEGKSEPIWFGFGSGQASSSDEIRDGRNLNVTCHNKNHGIS